MVFASRLKCERKGIWNIRGSTFIKQFWVRYIEGMSDVTYAGVISEGRAIHHRWGGGDWELLPNRSIIFSLADLCDCYGVQWELCPAWYWCKCGISWLSPSLLLYLVSSLSAVGIFSFTCKTSIEMLLNIGSVDLCGFLNSFIHSKI